jgi:hypothetical protein
MDPSITRKSYGTFTTHKANENENISAKVLNKTSEYVLHDLV